MEASPGVREASKINAVDGGVANFAGTENQDAQAVVDTPPQVSDADLIEIATEFRKGLLGNQSSQWRCAMVSWPLAGLLRAIYGVDCECVESDLGHCNHVWIKLADGRALDATADQFNHFNDCDYPPVYLGPRLNIHGVLPGDPTPSVSLGLGSALYAGGAE